MVRGDHATIFLEIIGGEGNPVTGKQLMKALNKRRLGTAEYIPYQTPDVRAFLRQYNITLLGEKPENQANRNLCRSNNNLLCHWQRTGEVPQYDDEGFDCFQKTGYGYCPKLQRKRRVPDLFETHLQQEAGSERRKVKELRERYLAPLNSVFGPEFSGENGLVRTIRGRGYALAASVSYEED